MLVPLVYVAWRLTAAVCISSIAVAALYCCSVVLVISLVLEVRLYWIALPAAQETVREGSESLLQIGPRGGRDEC